MKLKAKLIILFNVVAAISVLPVTLLGFTYINNQVKKELNDKMQLTANATVDKLDAWIRESTKVVESVAIVVNDTVDNKDINIKHLSALKAESNSKSISDLYIGLEDGKFIDGSEWIPDADFDPRTREWYTSAKERGKIGYSEPYLDKVTNKYAVSVGVPLTGKDGKLRGVIAEDILLDTLTQTINKLDLGGIGFGFLIDNSGHILAHKDKKLLNTNIKDNEELKEALTGKLTAASGGIDYKYNGADKLVMYKKLASTGWIFCLSIDKKLAYADIYNLRNICILITVLILLASALIALVLGIRLTKPLIALRNTIENASKENDLTLHFESKSKDEINDMVQALNHFTESIRKSFIDVADETRIVEENVKVIVSNIEKLNMSIEEVSATTEELSAGMEQTAATSEEMNAASDEIETTAEQIAQKAQYGARSAGEINKRAEELKANVIISQQNARDIREAVDKKLRDALEQSNAVEQIKTLTESILQITSQTNLLALNASIEAARAGEAGKGFAVVAGEIGKLADMSKETVLQIQSVTGTVTQAVNNLKYSSEQVLNFIDNHVDQDYENMVKTGEQYSRDAIFVNDLVKGFEVSSEELLITIKNIGSAVNEVARSANEGAEGTTNIAQKSTEIALMTQSVMQQALDSENSVLKLHETVSKFKI